LAFDSQKWANHFSVKDMLNFFVASIYMKEVSRAVRDTFVVAAERRISLCAATRRASIGRQRAKRNRSLAPQPRQLFT
ncbi:hypothetical protein, partial [Geobacillus stearothermophilus]|uniref:hypothetical protein n=1 Tax=Geobacillus stearothermophilus TaxID=1422 RepID=UPI003D220A22